MTPQIEEPQHGLQDVVPVDPITTGSVLALAAIYSEAATTLIQHARA